jgi:ABC-type transport system involved in multi-copper enzyme maturation permease subunit
VIAVAALTVVEIARRRFVLAALLGTVAIAALTAWGLHALHSGAGPHGHPLTDLRAREAGAALLPLIVYLFSFVLAFAAAMLGATALSAEVESGVLLPVLARPVSRAAVVFGKALGLGAVLCAYAAFSASLEFAVVDLTMGFLPPHPALAVCGLASIALVVLAFTLALGSRLGAIACGIVAIVSFGVAWLAGIVASLASVYRNELLVHAGTVSQLLFPSDALWRATAYQLEPVALVSQLQSNARWSGPFWVTDPPPAPTIVWSALWIVVALGVAARSFSTRDV